MIGLNWGNGFVTDRELINSRGLSNPIGFFEQAVTRPWVKKVRAAAAAAAAVLRHKAPGSCTENMRPVLCWLFV
jgi:hypothetical protein